jgi:hypothetical protein
LSKSCKKAGKSRHKIFHKAGKNCLKILQNLLVHIIENA